MMRRLGLLLGTSLWAAGCADVQPTGTRVVVDPTSTRNEAGGTDDVIQVSQKMLNSMRQDRNVQAMPSPRLILLDQDGITVDPKLREYNAKILYNQFAANLNRAAGTEFRFIDRKAVALERERQLKGEVKTSGIEPVTAGANAILTIELIALRGAQTFSVQYNFKLTGASDGVVLWTDTDTIVKRS
jgi:PBP1b-binding outer membrane lipoprotein LpoB